jgi:hypothetical protein
MKYAVARNIINEGEVIDADAGVQTAQFGDEGLLDAYSRAVIESAE